MKHFFHKKTFIVGWDQQKYYKPGRSCWFVWSFNLRKIVTVQASEEKLQRMYFFDVTFPELRDIISEAA